jgi:hypothetical protein
MAQNCRAGYRKVEDGFVPAHCVRTRCGERMTMVHAQGKGR